LFPCAFRMRVWEASLVFYFTCFIVAEILRWIVRTFVPKPPNSLTVQLLNEFIGTLQICTPMFDVGTILETYGLFGVFVEITVIELANCYMIRDCVASPCPIVTSCYRKRKILRRALYVLAVQITAAFLSSRLARLFFSIGVHPVHLEVATNYDCSTDLSVALTTGAAIEGAAVLLGKCVETVASDRYADSWLQYLVNSSFAGFICALGINFTGLYGNPIVASACTFNCLGVSHLGHLAVYWASPIVAWYISEFVLGVEDDFEEIEEEEPKKEVEKREMKKEIKSGKKDD
ncbi:hypothetical protein PENTCL1PPCAC_11958, partial [Pristionchus entomophagus]